MSESARWGLTISAKDVRVDGAVVPRGAESAGMAVTEAAARVALAAFAAVPAVDLVDIDAKIYGSGSRAKWLCKRWAGGCSSPRCRKR